MKDDAMTKEEIRLECLSMMVDNGSKYSLEKGQVFELAEKAYEFVTGIPPGDKKAPA